jgi:Transposase DDE domain
MAGGIEAVAASVSADLLRRLPRQNKKQREGLALLVGTMLDVRSANLMDLSASLPRESERIDMRYQWISRLLGNELIDTDRVMAPFAGEVLHNASRGGRHLVLIIDQSKANDTQQAIVVAVRVGGRSLPIAWRVKETEGAIGFAEQRAALETTLALLPAGAKVVLMGDRFYGNPDLIAWCRTKGWDWRLRLKADLLVFEEGGESTVAECFARGERMLTDVELTAKRVATNIGMVHEDGHPEPWFIAMSDAPTTAKTFDYGLRWGIEAMFSDFKSRGFGLEDSQLQRVDRMDRLILVMALALYWAVSTGMWAAENAALPVEKKRTARVRKRWLAA